MNQINNNKDVGFRGRQCAVIARLRGSASGGDQKRSRGPRRSLPMAAALLLGLALSMSAHAQKVNTSKPITVNEGSSSTFKVFLTKQPSGNVTVTLTQPSNTKVTIDTDTTEDGLQNTLTLTPTNWSTGLDVTVEADQDDNAVSEKVTVTISNDSSNQRKNVKIRVQDDDVVVGLRLNKTSLELLEGITSSTPGSRGEFTVRLASNPVTSRTINITPSQNSDVSVSPTSLTFNGADDHWKDKQTVTVSVNRDADANSETATITLSGSKVTPSNVSVKIQDEQDQGLTVSKRTLEINEGASGSFQVKLGAAPPFNRTVQFNATNGKASNVTLTPPSLTFTPLDWNTLKTVTVNAGQDSNADDSTVTIYPQFQVINNGAYKWKDITASPVTVSVIDDDVALSIQNSPLMVDEGKSGSFSVRLSERPAKAVELTLTQPANTEITIDTDSTTSGDQTTLNFTTANWGTFQAVEVTAADDVDNQDDTGTVSIRGEGVLGGAVNIVVIDDEDAKVSLTLSATSLLLNEGSSGSFEVRLNAQPANNRTVKLESDNPGLVFAPSPLTFEPSAWSTPARVVVTASQDDNKVDEDQPIKLSGIRITAGTEVSVTVKDDDFDVGVTLSKTSLTLNEGSSDSFTIRLDKKPGNNRTVEFTSDNTDLTFNPTSLAFDKTNWDSPQNVTVTARDDADKDDEDTPIQFSGTSIATEAEVSVTVKDDDFDVGVTPSITSLTLNEDSSDSFTIRLDKKPGNNRTVEFTSDNTDLTFNPTSLNFTTENWDDDQDVTVTATDDADKDDEDSTIQFSGTSITAKSLPVNVKDSDFDVGLALSESSLTLDENSSKVLTVRLDKKPGKDRTVELTSNNSDVTLDPASLTFTTENWEDDQEVTVDAGEDNDLTDDSATVTLAGTGITSKSLTVSVTDDDPGLILSTTSLVLAEGETASFQIKLTKFPPYSLIVVQVPESEMANSDLKLNRSPESSYDLWLPFTPSDWDIYRTVYVTAAHDDDSTNDSVSLSLSAATWLSGNFRNPNAASITISVLDDDLLELSADTLTVTEGGSSSFTVKLAERPSENVTVTLAQPSNPDVTFDTDADTSGNQNTLTFTTDNWRLPQTVTVNAVHDADQIDESGGVYVRLPGGGQKFMRVDVNDDDGIRLHLSANSLTLDEGHSGSFEVKLTGRPENGRTITLTSDNSEVSCTPATLTFDPSNWDTAQTVTVSAAADKDTIDDDATISLSGIGVTSASVAVSVTDKNKIELIIWKSSLTLKENEYDSFEVKLGRQPTAPVTVTVAQPSNADVTVDADTQTVGNQNTLSFSTSNWNSYQRVRVKATKDTDYTNDSANISLTAAGGGYDAETGSVAVTVLDNDLLELSTDRLTLTEGTSGEITVKLKAPPSENVTVTLSQPSNPDITLDTDPGTAGNQNTLTFTPLNSSQPQKVKINAAADDNQTHNWGRISFILPSGGSKTLSVRVLEDDVGLILSKTSLTLQENGTVEFTVRLAAQPTAEVTVTLAQPSNTDVTVSTYNQQNSNTLIFEEWNWNSYRTVVVRAADDADALDDSASITLSASGGGYDSVTGSVAVKVPDDDFIELSTESLTLDEGGNDTFTVVLKSTPSENVTVTLSDGLHVASDTESETTGPQKTLQFTPSTWSTPQTVTVNALHDDDVTDEQTKIDLEASNGWRKSLSVQIKDDENELILSSQSLTLYERYASWFRIKLSRQPTADVTVTLVQPSNTDVTLDTDQSTDGNQNTRTFTTSDWNTYKKVWVAAAEDTDILNDSANISITAAGGGYDDATASIAITVIDDDLPEFSPSEPYAILGKLNDFTVKLRSQPSEKVVMTFTTIFLSLIDTNTEIPGYQDTLTFTPSNWDIPQRVTLDAPLSFFNRHPKYEWWGWLNLEISGDRSRAVAIPLLDRDFELTLSKTSLTLDEGGSGTFTAKLSHQPNSDISLPLKSDNSDVTFSPKSLNFTRSNWSANQTVTVNAAQDSDSNEDTATISFIGAGGASVAVSVTEAQKGFSLSDTALTMQENDSAAFQVNLTKQPTANVTVTVAQPSNTDVTVDTDKAAAGNQNTLDFTTSNWNAPQTVHVRAAADDADGTDDSAGISLTAAGGGYDTVTGNMPVTVRDDDHFEFSTASLTLAENSSGSVSVRLLKRPPENATVTLQRSPTLNPDVTVDTDADTAGLQNTLTFTPSNWNAYQTVHITAADDTDFTDESGNIRFSLPDGRERLLPVSVNDNDDDSYRLILSATALAFKEGWGDRIRIKLAKQPTAEVTVTLTLSSNTDIRIQNQVGSKWVDENTLTFTRSNWNTYQTLLVADYGDEDINDDSATISITAEGGGYDSATGNVSVKVLDDDLIEVLTDPLTVSEGGSGDLKFRMTREPSENMTFALLQFSPWCPTSYVGKVTYDTDATTPGNQNTLTFTPSNWSTIRTVTINVADDAYQYDGHACLRFLYPNGVDRHVVEIVVINNDKELTLSTKSLNLQEGGSKTFTVKMANRIRHERSIELEASSDSGVTVTPTTLTFNRNNWDTPQTVTVTATEDDDANNETGKISLTSDLTKPASVSVQVTDNDAGAGLSLSAALPAPAGRVVPGMLTPRRAGRSAGSPAVSLTSVAPGGIEPRPARLERPRDSDSPGTLEPRLDRSRRPGDGPPKPPGKGVIGEGIPHRWRHHIGSGDIADST